MAFYKWGIDKLNDPFEVNKMPVVFRRGFYRKVLIIIIGFFILSGLGFLYTPVYMRF